MKFYLVQWGGVYGVSWRNHGIEDAGAGAVAGAGTGVGVGAGAGAGAGTVVVVGVGTEAGAAAAAPNTSFILARVFGPRFPLPESVAFLIIPYFN